MRVIIHDFSRLNCFEILPGRFAPRGGIVQYVHRLQVPYVQTSLLLFLSHAHALAHTYTQDTHRSSRPLGSSNSHRP